MNYGPRFRSSAFTPGVTYDRKIAEANRRDRAQMWACVEAMPLYKQELRKYKMSERCKKRVKGHEREEAELRMAEVVRQAVKLLEAGMAELMQIPVVETRPHYVRPLALYNAIVDLKTKCGVVFEPSEYYHRVESRADFNPEDEVQRRIEKQRHDRELKLREVAERLKARPK